MATQEPKRGRCGAQTRNGGYCEKYPAEGRSRCRFHGGATPTKDENPNVGAPENNNFAEGNPGGGAPELNTNAVSAHGMWSDWRKYYERLPLDRKAHIEALTEETVVKTKPYTPDLDPEERDRLARKYWVLREISNAVDYDIFAGMFDDSPEDARGVMVKEEVEIDGETYEVDKPNPALDRMGQLRARQRKIEDRLNYYAQYHDENPPWEQSEEDEREDLAEILSER